MAAPGMARPVESLMVPSIWEVCAHKAQISKKLQASSPVRISPHLTGRRVYQSLNWLSRDTANRVSAQSNSNPKREPSAPRAIRLFSGDGRKCRPPDHFRRAEWESVTVEFVFRRVIWIVLDSVGIGEMPDAAKYGDAGSDTLGNIARLRGLKLPNLARLGLGKIGRA